VQQGNITVDNEKLSGHEKIFVQLHLGYILDDQGLGVQFPGKTHGVLNPPSLLYSGYWEVNRPVDEDVHSSSAQVKNVCSYTPILHASSRRNGRNFTS